MNSDGSGTQNRVPGRQNHPNNGFYSRLSNRRGVQINVWNCTFPKTNKRWVSNKHPGPFRLLNFIVE